MRMTLCLSQIEMQAALVTKHLGVKGEGWTVEIPLHVKSEQHASRNWGAKHGRTTKEKDMVSWALFGRERQLGKKPPIPCVVTMTRIAPGLLDTDNLAYAFKATRDAVAKWLGVKDGPTDTRVRWVYDQRRGKPKTYAAIIKIEEAR
jgi:hypothetical protein